LKTAPAFTGTALVFAFLIVACGNPNDVSGGLHHLPALEGTVSIDGIARYGWTLTADTSNVGGTGDIAFQWRRTYTDGRTINVGTGPTYTLRLADRGNSIAVVVFRRGYSNAIRSDPVKIVADQQDPDGDILISFACIRDERINRLYIYFDDPPKIITLLEPEQYAGSIEWWLGRLGERSLGVDDGVSGHHSETLAVDARLLEYRIGTHFLTIKVRKNSVSYSKLIELRFRLTRL